MNFFGFNLSSADLWLLGICGVLILVLVNFTLHRYNAFRAAATTFRSKVLTELEGLYPLPINWPGNMQIDPFLRSKFPKLQSVVEEFKVCLSKRRQKIFINTWVEYYSANGDNRCQCYHHYMPFINTSTINGKQITEDTRNTYKETFKHNVDKLLSFAKQK